MTDATPQETRYERHPLSALWPDMPSEEFNALQADIRANGLRHPIVLHEGQVLDGWHRYRAWLAESCNFELLERQFGEEEDPISYVISVNARRRHLAPRDIARIVVSCNNWQPPQGGRPKKNGKNGRNNGSAPKTKKEMAKQAGVSESTIARAKREIRDEKAKENGEKPKPKSTKETETDKRPPRRTATQKLNDKINALEDENLELAENLDQMEVNYEVLEGDFKDLQSSQDAKAIDTRIQELREEVNAARHSMNSALAKVRSANHRVKTLEKENASLKARIQELEEAPF